VPDFSLARRGTLAQEMGRGRASLLPAMDNPEPSPLSLDREILRVDPARREKLRAILDYVRNIHHHIDPDRFRIDATWIETMLRALEGGPIEEVRIGVTYADLLLLESATDAAATFAQRTGFAPLTDVDDDELSEIFEWLGAQADLLFRRPPTIH